MTLPFCTNHQGDRNMLRQCCLLWLQAYHCHRPVTRHCGWHLQSRCCQETPLLLVALSLARLIEHVCRSDVIAAHVQIITKYSFYLITYRFLTV